MGFKLLFDEFSRFWTDDPESNMEFLRGEEQYWNERVKETDISLSDVIKSLGFSEKKDLSNYIWRRGSRIKFGMFENTEANRAFVNGYEPSVMLRLNVHAI